MLNCTLADLGTLTSYCLNKSFQIRIACPGRSSIKNTAAPTQLRVFPDMLKLSLKESDKAIGETRTARGLRQEAEAVNVGNCVRHIVNQTTCLVQGSMDGQTLSMDFQLVRSQKTLPQLSSAAMINAHPGELQSSQRLAAVTDHDRPVVTTNKQLDVIAIAVLVGSRYQ